MSASDLASESLSVWDDIATYWDENYTKDGNLYWEALQAPSIKRFLADKLAGASEGPGSGSGTGKTGRTVHALDLATGNGIVARLMASHGADVLATDGSDAMLAIAAGHVAEGMKVKFRKLDVTSDEEFEKLVGEEKQKVSYLPYLPYLNYLPMDIITFFVLIPSLGILVTFFPSSHEKRGIWFECTKV